MKPDIAEKVNRWLTGHYDQETKDKIRHLMEQNENELTEAFYKDMEFGTGGLRGIMGVGTNRMNIYTVGMATQGLCNYLLVQFRSLPEISVAIAYDSRNNSRLFAETAAGIFSANNIKAYLFESLRPTPELSFAIRQLKCQSGIVITASHNPKEYNGYKAYWDDGAQVISPHDKNIINEVRKITVIDQVKFNGPKSLIITIGEEIDAIYTDRITSLCLSPEAIDRNRNIKIVYTPLHGSGVNLVPRTLKKLGFTTIFNIPEQDVSDGNFPTIISPNPEEHAALDMAIEKARQVDADIVMATDPDADRVGIAVKNNSNEFILLNGNQTASVMIWYLLSRWAEKKKLTGSEYIIKTIVTTELLNAISNKYKVECIDVYTGFKYIAQVIRQYEGKRKFIGGGEESYGYLVDDFVRDKDAVISCALFAEITAYAKDKGKTFFDLLLDIYTEFGFFKEELLSITKKGKSGAEEIQKMMNDFRSDPPKIINDSRVIYIKDYLQRVSKNLITGKEESIAFDKSDVLQFFLEDGTKISMRPSGTEPKIKFYFSVRGTLDVKENFDKINNLLSEKIKKVIASLHLNS